MQIKKRGAKVDEVDIKIEKGEEEDSFKQNQNNFFKNLKLIIKKCHVRFEDDHFSRDKPYSIGVVIDVSAEF